jgi:hypothetical protein
VFKSFIDKIKYKIAFYGTHYCVVPMNYIISKIKQSQFNNKTKQSSQQQINTIKNKNKINNNQITTLTN